MVEHEQQQQEMTSEERTDAAFSAFQKEIADSEKANAAKAAAWNHGTEEADDEAETDETEEEVSEKADEKEISRSEYYARMVEMDRENRMLKQQLKNATAGGDLAQLAKNDPMAVLGKLGIGIDDILARWAGEPPAEEGQYTEQGEKSTNIPTYSNEELVKLRQQVEQMQNQQQQATYQQQIAAEVSKIDQAIAGSEDPSRWEIIRELKDEGSYQVVLETAAELWKNYGQVPSYEEVLDTVEQYYEESLSGNWTRMSKLEKLAKKMGVQGRQTHPEGDEATGKPKASAPGPTLSSKRTVDAPVPSRGLDEKARYQRALDALAEIGD